MSFVLDRERNIAQTFSIMRVYSPFVTLPSDNRLQYGTHHTTVNHCNGN